MNDWIKRILASVVLAAVALALLPQASFAGTASDVRAQQSGPAQVNIGIYLINLEQLDVRTGNYTAELFLSFKCPGQCDISDFRVVDGKYTILDKDTIQANGSTQNTYHLRVDLNENLVYRDFPFDRHYLGFRIESADQTSRDLEFLPDDTLAGLAPDLQMAGWSVSPDYETEVQLQSYKIFQDKFSRYTFRILLSRPELYGWLKALLPATIILISGLLSYLLHYDAANNGIAVVTGALVGSVLFNINLTSTLPATGNLTAADLFMIVNYIALTVTLAIMIAVYVFKERGNIERARRLMHRARWIVPPTWIALQALMLVYTLVIRPTL